MSCNQPNNNPVTPISAAAQQAASDLLAAGQAYADAGMQAEALQLYAQAWDVLAQAGDRYADNAAGVLGRGGDAADNFFSTLVENHWNNTVGADAYANLFDNVAAQHLGNYLDYLRDSNGTPPDTQFIVSSYESALALSHLDASAAFDGAWATAVPGQTIADSSWAGFLGMEAARITTSETTNGLNNAEASALLALDFAQTLASISQSDPNLLLAIITGSPAIAAQSPTLRDFAKRFGEGAWDYLKDALESGDDWIVPDTCEPETDENTAILFNAAQRDIVKSGVWPVCSMKRQAASFC